MEIIDIKGLTEEEVQSSRNTYGRNELERSKGEGVIRMLISILKEPMLLLLMAIAVIYIVLGEYGEAAFMGVALFLVSGISLYQDNRSRLALQELEKLSEPICTVLRDGRLQKIPNKELVVGDYVWVTEGQSISADGVILRSSDFTLNESALTGESASVYKEVHAEVYSGTTVVSGEAIMEVQKVGKSTKLGQIGASLQDIQVDKSPLQIQIEKFVKRMALGGTGVFILVVLYQWYTSGLFLDGLLQGLTLAMSVLPEEIPVAFTTFMALGARKMMQQGVIIKKSAVVETLGSTTVICTDKTGTITQNSMELHALYLAADDRLYRPEDFGQDKLGTLLEYSVWSSKIVPFDPMEKSLHAVYTAKRKSFTEFSLLKEYPLSGKPPMMTQVLQSVDGRRVIAAKGAPEAILKACGENEVYTEVYQNLGSKGFRVLGVAKGEWVEGVLPEKQEEFKFTFLGFVVFLDPPKENIATVFEKIKNAGIKTKVITGDNAPTTAAIAGMAGIVGPSITGEIYMKTTDKSAALKDTVLFTRMYPEAKLDVVNALKEKGEVIAMIGDGVNDAPALKAAHIGVAMGNKGTEIAKAAADVVLLGDDLEKLWIGIASGRRIYANLKKAIQYILSIHIPIILIVSLPLFLGWAFPSLFSPVHVIFLELLMGPTCSIVYENEPMEKNAMEMPPRRLSDTFLSGKELLQSVLQGAMISAAVLGMYQYAQEGGEVYTRSMVFTTLIFANIALSLANRSFYYNIWQTFGYKNPLMFTVNAGALLLLLIILYVPFISNFFEVQALAPQEILICLGTALLSVVGFELYKWQKRKK
jgi:Ca2+-transporting ATPase